MLRDIALRINLCEQLSFQQPRTLMIPLETEGPRTPRGIEMMQKRKCLGYLCTQNGTSSRSASSCLPDVHASWQTQVGVWTKTGISKIY